MRPCAPCSLREPTAIFTALRKTQRTNDRRFPSRLSRDSRLYAPRADQPLRARREDAEGRVYREAAGRQVARDDLHEVVDAHARVVRGGRLAARRTRIISVAA